MLQNIENYFLTVFFFNYYDNYVKTLAKLCPIPTFVAEVVPAASSVACWTGRTRSSIFVWSMTPPVPPENTMTQTLAFSKKGKSGFHVHVSNHAFMQNFVKKIKFSLKSSSKVQKSYSLLTLLGWNCLEFD